MSLTPLEIKKQEFSTSMRGLNPDEVRTFLSLIAGEWEHLRQENKEQQEQIKDLRGKVDHYKQLEKSLHDTLQDVRDSAETRLQGAQHRADQTMEKARLQAADIVRQAEQQRGQIYGEVLGLLRRRTEIVGGIRAYLQASIDSLVQFEDDPAGRFRAPESSGTGTNLLSSQEIDALVDELD
jgi:cell division initiation protein